MPLRALVLVLALAPSTAGARLLSSVEVPAPTPPVGTPPNTARACVIDLDVPERMPVVSQCPLTCYREAWDGPLLVVENACSRTAWVSYEYDTADGRMRTTDCYELAPGMPGVIPEPAMERTSPRRIVLSMEPGPGYPRRGFTPPCANTRVASADR